MGIDVVTETTCDRCGKVHRRDGAEKDYPPVGWSRAELSSRGEGNGWTNRESWKWILCPACTSTVLEVISSTTNREVKKT